MKWKAADSFKVILKRVKKEVNGFTIREIETVPKVNYKTEKSTFTSSQPDVPSLNT